MSSEPQAARPALLGLRHLALRIPRDRFEATCRFYRDALGMRVDWEPDPDNLYLSSGTDNLALHVGDGDVVNGATSALDHLGFFVASADDVQKWHAYLEPQADDLQLKILNPPKQHRDGSTSFYLRDPSGAQVQILHVPSCT